MLEPRSRMTYASVRSFSWVGVGRRSCPNSLASTVVWIAVKEFSVSYHNSKTILFTIYPEYGNLE